MANRGPVRRGKVSSAVSGAVRRGHAPDSNNPTVGGGSGGTGGGTPGPTGPAGPAGADGAPGAPGAPGAAGATGKDGASIPGFDGPEGEQGEPGPPGRDGKAGSHGAPGLDAEITEGCEQLVYPVGVTQYLDQVAGGITVGDILIRTANGWARLAAPASGFFLGGNGAGAAPSYQGVTGFAHPLAQAAHLEYTVNIATAFINQRGGSGSLTATTQGHKAAGAILATGQFYQLGTAAATNSTASFTSATSGSAQTKELSFAWDFDVSFLFLTDAAAVTSVRYMFGVGVNNEDTDTITAANWIGFRFSTGAGDAGWVGVVYDGTQVVSASVAAVAANTRYILRVRRVGTSVFFSVNGSAETAITTHVPSNNVYAGIVGRVTALTNSVRSMWIGRIWCDYGT